MRRSKVIASLLVVSMVTATGSAFAEDQQRQGGDAHAAQAQRGAHGAMGRGGMSHMQMNHRGGMGHGDRAQVHDASMDRPGGPIPHQDWHQGERVPAEYQDRNYVVDNWHEHGLQAPPRGYQWVGVNGDYVLAAVATGVIASVIAAATH